MLEKVKSFIKKTCRQNKKNMLKVLIVLFFWVALIPQQSFVVNAQTTNNNAAVTTAEKSKAAIQKEEIIWLTTFFEIISNLAYVILRPLVALAWLAMDNSLIYWSFMWLDVPLWYIWQIVRNFANYALWIIFLIGIIAYNFSPDGKMLIKNIKNPKDLIKKTLIASVLIQSSRFLVMACVDISTILTYSVWWIPLTVAQSVDKETEQKLNDSRMFEQDVFLNLWDSSSSVIASVDDMLVNYYVATSWETSKYIAPCKIITKKWSDNEQQAFIIWRSFEWLTWIKAKNEFTSTEAWYCIYYWSLISFVDFYNWGTGYQSKLIQFEKDIQDPNTNSWHVKDLVNAWIIFPVSMWQIPFLKEWELKGSTSVNIWKTTYTGKKIWCDWHVWVVSSEAKENGFQCLYNETDLSIWNVFKKANSMTWPFASLYTSAAVFSSLKSNPSDWIWQKFVITVINVLFSVLLVLPLCALVIVLFARIWTLWIVIALSPFIVLVNVFNWSFNIKLWKWADISNLINLLLAPVLVSFAVSLSLVFMTALKNNLWSAYIPRGESVDCQTEAQKETDYCKYKANLTKVTWMDLDNNWDLWILWFIKIKLDSALLNISRFISMLFWLWITRFLLFWAIKQSSIWASIWKMLQDFWEKTIWSIPIIPIWKNWLSYNAIKELPTDISNKINTPLENKNKETLNALLGNGNKNNWSTITYSEDWAKMFYSWNTVAEWAFQKSFWDGVYFEQNIWSSLSLIDSIYSDTNSERAAIRGNASSWFTKEMWNAYKKLLEVANTKGRGSVESVLDNMNKREWLDIDVSGIEVKEWDITFVVTKKTDKKNKNNILYELAEKK